ncbi:MULTISPECIES: DUF4937 domain-containing protein [unclassified Bacillus cereus group]|uniref:DUF4937 domain-containing protein n=1 Tax=unclassified Bacillus cereus group TaxID=2750818 RepID=UPI001F58A1B8|nr:MULTISPECIES: DUF4937 domain-containing protein [unclassified Bacillus cereus group]
MLLKTIFCQVEKEKMSLFSKAQERWGNLQNVNGFLGQCGGWDQEEACIFTLWENTSTYQTFMDEIHDSIFNNSNQQETYVACDIELYETLFHIKESLLTNAIAKSTFIRTSICDVKSGKEEQFLHVQRTIWNEGMRETAGMLGGVVGKSLKNANRYIVLSFWKDEKPHRYYRNEIFPTLYEQANVASDVEHVQGKKVEYIKEWLVRS